MQLRSFMILSAVILIILSVFNLCTCSKVNSSPPIIEGADWPNWRGQNWNSILSDVEWDYNKLKEGEILWQIDVGQSFASVAVVDKYLYTMGYLEEQEHVYCFDINDGSVIWDYAFPSKKLHHNGSRSTPTVDGEYVFALGQIGHLVCLNKSDGSVVWEISSDDNIKLQNTWGVSGSPRIEGDVLYVNMGEKGIALDKHTGAKLWGEASYFCGYATPVLFEYNSHKYIAIFSYKSLIILYRETGEIAYTYSWPTDHYVNASDPVIIDNMIFISSGYGQGSVLLEINENSLDEVWRKENDGSTFSSFIYRDGYIYGNFSVADENRGFVCLNAATGEYCWHKDSGTGSVLMVDDKLILLDEKGEIIVAEVAGEKYRELIKFQIKEKRKLFWTPPVLCKGRLFIKNYSGNLLCIDISK